VWAARFFDEKIRGPFDMRAPLDPPLALLVRTLQASVQRPGRAPTDHERPGLL
jgi:hypothetical protein